MTALYRKEKFTERVRNSRRHVCDHLSTHGFLALIRSSKAGNSFL